MNVGDRVRLSRSYINSLEFMHEHLKHHKQHNCITVVDGEREGTIIKVRPDDDIVVLWDGCRVSDPKNHIYAEMDLTVTVTATPTSQTRSRTRYQCSPTQ